MAKRKLAPLVQQLCASIPTLYWFQAFKPVGKLGPRWESISRAKGRPLHFEEERVSWIFPFHNHLFAFLAIGPFIGNKFVIIVSRYHGLHDLLGSAYKRPPPPNIVNVIVNINDHW